MTERQQTFFDLRHYLQVLWRRKFIVLQGAIIVPVIVAVVVMLQPKEYTATARVMVENQPAAASVATGVDLSGQTPDQRQLSTLASFVVTPEIAQRVDRQLGIFDTPQSLAKRVSATAVLDANVIEVTATAPSPEGAARLANAFAQQFVSWRAETQQKTLQAAIDLLDAQIAGSPDTTSPAYQDLVTRRRQLTVLKALATGGVSLGEPALPPTSPSSPRPKRDVAMGLAAGLVLGIGLAFLLDALNVKIRSLEELREYSDLPVLATIPELGRAYRKTGKLVSLDEPRSSAAESFRFLRTNLDFINFNHDVKSILVTSPLPGQGKSTTIGNLAVTLVLAGKKVAVVEGDLRRPALHKYFQVVNSKGLTTVVSGMTTLDETLRTLNFASPSPSVTVRGPDGDGKRRGPVDDGGSGQAQTPETAEGVRPAVATAERADPTAGDGPPLRLLTSGPLPPNPGDIVMSDQLSEVLARLARDSDYVLVDSPPLFAVGDAVAMAAKVDGIILVVRLEETTRDMLRQAEETLMRLPTRTLGFVVTGVKRSAAGHYHYQDYYA